MNYEDPTSKWTLFSGVDKYEYDLFSKFFTRPYFSRRWIIQEVALAKEISLYCGGAVMTEKVVSAVGELHSLPTREWHGSDSAFAFLAMLTRLRSAEGVKQLNVDQARGKAPMQFSIDFVYGGGNGN